jgi:hypothetical protein
MTATGLEPTRSLSRVPRAEASSAVARELVLKAPLSGQLVPLEQVPDPVFAQKMGGDGIAIDLVTESLLAPCDGARRELLHEHDTAREPGANFRGWSLSSAQTRRASRALVRHPARALHAVTSARFEARLESLLSNAHTLQRFGPLDAS